MQYMLMMFEPETAFRDRTGDKKDTYWGAWKAYTEALRQAGLMAGGNGLQPPLTATTLRLKGEARQVQDGPYAEGKEQLGGFYIIDVPNLDAALEWAARAPAASYGAVEVRPVLVA